MTDKPITWRLFFEGFGKGLNKRQRIYIPKSLIYLVAKFNSWLLRIFPKFNPPITYYRYKRTTSHTSYDVSDTKKELGYVPDNDFEEQINNIVQWYLTEKKIGRLKFYK
jgi:nucleoside-diphosphate-sugar epimerase